LRELLRRLRGHQAGEVAIERPDGQAGNKDDRFDAFVLADTLRPDRARLWPLTPDTPETVTLRAAVRARKDLVVHWVALANQLRAHLRAFHPAPVGLFHELDGQMSVKFLARFDCQDRVDWLSEKRLAAFLAGIRYSGSTTAEAMHARILAAPRGATGASGAAAVQVTRALLGALRAQLSRWRAGVYRR
jgi:transposase